MTNSASDESSVFRQQPRSDFEQSVNLTVFFKLVAKSWYWLAVGGVLFGFLFGVYSFRSPRMYHSEALVTVIEDAASGSSGSSSGAGRLGAVASMVGLNVGGSQDRRAEYIALLSSRRLIAELIARENLLPVLYASKWDAATRSWKTPEPPTVNSAIEYFSKSVLVVIEDRKTGLVRVSIDWFDPKLSAAWANSLVSMVNADVRQTTISDAQSTLRFLNAEIERTSEIQVREGIYRLLEGSLSRIALANVQEQYALKMLDPARAPDPQQFVRPRPLLAAVAGGVFGVIFALSAILWRSRHEFFGAW
jgi:uncharacterized protein involved in exopolysaccharide biosynthesis